MRILICAAALLPGLSACAEAPESRTPAVENAWVRPPIVAGRPGAAYFTVSAGAQAVTLESIASPQVERIEIHQSVMSGGMMKMTPLASVEIPSGGSIAFEPGGRHAMLFGIDPAVKPGDRIKLVFKLQRSAEIVAEAEVRAPDAADHSGDQGH